MSTTRTRQAELGIPHQFSEVKGAGHVYEDIVSGLPDGGFAFWRRAFSSGAGPAGPERLPR
jgi:hypothetical protein